MANGYEVRIGEPTKSADGKRLMPFVMIFREEQAQESIHDLKPCMSDSSISRQAVIDAIDEIESEVADGDGFQYEKWRQFFCDLPPVDIDLSDYSDRLWRNAYEQGKADAEPERKKGQWQEDPSGYGFWICSNCGFVSEASGANILYSFCPHCGAEMKGEADE